MAILIKRYANRKLYNTDTSRYITLKGIAELIENGEEVRVVDNETGEDITSIALSQILVDNERSKGAVSGSVLTELISRGGDVLYGALRRGVGDAQDGIGEIQKNVRRLVQREGEGGGGRGGLGDWIAYSTHDMEKAVQRSMERVLSDIDALNENLDRVARALERLGPARPAADADLAAEPDPATAATSDRVEN